MHFDLSRMSFHTNQLKQGVPDHVLPHQGHLIDFSLGSICCQPLPPFSPRLLPLLSLAPGSAAHALVQWTRFGVNWMLLPDLLPCCSVAPSVFALEMLTRTPVVSSLLDSVSQFTGWTCDF